MDIHEIINGEVEFKHEDKSFKIKRLSLYELSYDIEKQVKDDYYADIQKKSNMLTGKDKIEYIQSMKEIGDDDVVKLCLAKSATFRGRCEELSKILNKCQKVPMEDVEALIMDEKYWTLVYAMQNYALSGKLVKEEVKAESAGVGEAVDKKK